LADALDSGSSGREAIRVQVPSFAPVSTGVFPRISAITAPTLIFHATDDMLQLFHNAEFAAAHIPGAKLVRFEKGGHLLGIVEQKAISAALQKHILDHAANNDLPPTGP
jgi:pimeloyl-ACP methyl ester carboxylesterase